MPREEPKGDPGKPDEKLGKPDEKPGKPDEKPSKPEKPEKPPKVSRVAEHPGKPLFEAGGSMRVTTKSTRMVASAIAALAKQSPPLAAFVFSKKVAQVVVPVPPDGLAELDERPEVPIKNPPVAPVMEVEGSMRVKVSSPFVVVKMGKG